MRRAVDEGNTNTIDILCRLGADISAGRGLSNISAKPTLLHLAADNMSLHVTRALLENGANPNVAIQDGSYLQNTASWLYRTGCSGISGTTPLHTAAKKYIEIARANPGLAEDLREQNLADIMRELVQKGANVQITDPNGFTPIKMLQDAGFSDLAGELSQVHRRPPQNAVHRYVNRNPGEQDMQR